MGKIIFIDVDGTLVDYEGNLPDSAVKAIRQARANGHRVYMCTGRSKAEVYPPLWDIGLDGIIGGNGCYVDPLMIMYFYNHPGRISPGCISSNFFQAILTALLLSSSYIIQQDISFPIYTLIYLRNVDNTFSAPASQKHPGDL